MRILRTRCFARAAAVACGGALAIGMVVATASPASASPLSCGATVTASVKLTGNIVCPSSTPDAITIGAADVTINLNGHSILGPGANDDTEGVVDNADAAGTPYNDVTIENGTISNFGADIDIEEQASQSPCGSYLTGVVVKNITTTNFTEGAGYSFYGSCLSGASIQKMSISDAYQGIELDQSQAITVSGNNLNSPFYGLYDYRGTGNTWSGNTLSNVTDEGVELALATASVVSSNTVTGGANATGVYEVESSGLSITGNSLSDLYGGVFSGGSEYGTISSNKGSHNAYGMFGDDTTDYTYSGNQFNNGQYGIETDFPLGEVMKGNTTNHNSELGVYIYTDNETAPPNEGPTLNNNTGNYNRFGLYSQTPTSGKGNHATGNTIVQCYQVTCVGGPPAVEPPSRHRPTTRRGCQPLAGLAGPEHRRPLSRPGGEIEHLTHLVRPPPCHRRGRQRRPFRGRDHGSGRPGERNHRHLRRDCHGERDAQRQP